MKKTICKVDYDTESAELVGKVTAGSIGDPTGYEECLFKTPDGKFKARNVSKMSFVPMLKGVKRKKPRQ